MTENKIKITPAKGKPMLHWAGKKSLDYVKGFPTQLIEVFDPLKTGRAVETPTYEELKDNWQNLLFYGDNKDVLATLLELGFKGKIDLIYIDPPFNSGFNRTMKVKLRGLKKSEINEKNSIPIIQQTTYFDIWNNDTYLQFMYERLMLLKELLADTGSIYVHLDWHVGHYVKIIMDEVFGEDNFRNEIIWHYISGGLSKKTFGRKHDTILFYSKTENYNFNYLRERKNKYKEINKIKTLEDEKGKFVWYIRPGTNPKVPNGVKTYLDGIVHDVWDIPIVNPQAEERKSTNNFATQKPETLLERIIKASSNPGDLVLDCFIGSGTTSRVAQKLGRRWIGCDINKGAIHLTSRELQKIINEQVNKNKTKYPTFATYKVNNYDLKLLRTEAIELAVKHIGIRRIRTDEFFNGTIKKNLVKIIDFNHPLTLLDLQLIQDELKKRPNENRDITVVCLGKELAVDSEIDKWNKKYSVNKIKVIELKTDKRYSNFLIHKPDEAKIDIKRKNNKAIIEIQNFISPTIIEKLNIDNKFSKIKIPDFRSMIDCVLIDNNYDGKIFRIVYSDVPKKKNDLVKGKYEIEISNKKTRVAVKVVDILGEEVINTFEI